MAHLNIRSILSKIDQLRLDLPLSGLDVLTISETWLSAQHENKLTSIPGYKFSRFDRQTLRQDGNIKAGGGLGLYCKVDIQLDTTILQKFNLSNCTIELQWSIIIRPNSKSIIIGNIYRPPDGKLGDAFKLISEQLAKIPKLEKYETVLIGDFNADNTDEQKSPAQLIRQFAVEHGFQQLITQPTRY